MIFIIEKNNHGIQLSTMKFHLGLYNFGKKLIIKYWSTTAEDREICHIDCIFKTSNYKT